LGERGHEGALIQELQGHGDSAERVKYKISDVGINHPEAARVFKKPDKASGINITNTKDMTVVGDGNVVNTQLTDLSRALVDLIHPEQRRHRRSLATVGPGPWGALDH
jgi:hypothetical protein